MKLEAIGAAFALLSEFSVFLLLFRLIFVFIVTISRRIVQGICYEMRFFSPPRTVHFLRSRARKGRCCFHFA